MSSYSSLNQIILRSGARRIYVLLEQQDPASRALMLGIAGIAASRGWFMLWAVVSQLDQAELNGLTNFDPHAIILLPGAIERVPAEVLENRLVVGAGVDLTPRGYPSAVIDDVQTGHIAAEHLLGKGITSFATFGEAKWDWVQDRARGFRETVLAGGHSCSDWIVNSDDPSLLAPTWCHPESFVPWLDQLPKPVGILCCCDAWSDVLCFTVRAKGLRIPEDVAVVGVDNDEVHCEFCNPPLTSVALSHRTVGGAAALLAEQLMNNQTPEQLLTKIPGGAIAQRRSTDTFAVPDSDVAAALAFISANAQRPIAVADVLRHVPAYQHRLERGFKRYLGRTMLHEIRRVHVEHAKRLLYMTDLPIPEIATRSGFRNTTKLGIAFRKETGTTPTAYRRQRKQEH